MGEAVWKTSRDGFLPLASRSIPLNSSARIAWSAVRDFPFWPSAAKLNNNAVRQGKKSNGEIAFERSFRHPALAEIFGRQEKRADGDFEQRIFCLDFRVIKSWKVAFNRNGRIFQLRVIDKSTSRIRSSPRCVRSADARNFADILFRAFRQTDAWLVFYFKSEVLIVLMLLFLLP